MHRRRKRQLSRRKRYCTTDQIPKPSLQFRKLTRWLKITFAQGANPSLETETR